MRVGAVKQALADKAAAIEGLNTYGYSPAAAEVPCLYAGEVEIDYDQTFGGDVAATFTLYLLTSSAEDAAGQQLLDDYLSTQGPSSVKAALEGTAGVAQDLGGLVDDLHVHTATGYRMYQIGEYSYYGAKLPVRVIGSREG